MARVLGSDVGGIFGLHRLLTEHGEAIEYELLTLQLRREWLGTRRLTWRDLKVVVVNSPPGGALNRSIDPEGALWTPATYVLAGVQDTLAIQVWQAGNGKGPKPHPMWRPGQKTKKRGRNVADRAREALQGVTDGG